MLQTLQAGKLVSWYLGGVKYIAGSSITILILCNRDLLFQWAKKGPVSEVSLSC